MAVEWMTAPQPVIDVAKRIIKQHHPHLLGARIAFIMRSEAPESNGKVTYGKAKKVSAELQVHIPFDFIIWLARDRYLTLSAMQREALIDHELSHCEWDGDVARIKGHDVEEFTHIIERYGFWWPSSDRFEMAVQQVLPLPLPQTGEPRQGSVGTIDFGRIAKDAETAMRADGLDVEVTYTPAMARGE